MVSDQRVRSVHLEFYKRSKYRLVKIYAQFIGSRVEVSFRRLVLCANQYSVFIFSKEFPMAHRNLVRSSDFVLKNLKILLYRPLDYLCLFSSASFCLSRISMPKPRI